MGLADVDVAHLLVEQLLGERLLYVGLQLGDRDVGPGHTVASGLRIGALGVDRGDPIGISHKQKRPIAEPILSAIASKIFFMRSSPG